MTDNGQPRDIERIEQLIEQLDATADPQFRNLTVQFVQVVMDFHRNGIARLVQIISQSGDAAADLFEQLSNDEIVGQLLVLYDQHPHSLESRVSGALEKVRPLLNSHGGDVELLKIEQGVVHLRLEGNCNGCPSSSLTLKNAIETAVYEAAPDITDLQVTRVTDQATAAFVPLETINMNR